MPRRPALKKRADNSTAPCSSKPKKREAPKTPPDQQLVASQPSAPRKRRAQNNKDQASTEPSAKRIAIDNTSNRFLSTDSHDDTPSKVVISPTGTMCKCHLKPGAICWHTIHEPHVSNPKARARYESLAPVKQVIQRVRVNKSRDRLNAIKELEIDTAATAQDSEDWLKRQNVREKRAAASNIKYAEDGEEDSKDRCFEEDDTEIEESDVDVEDSEDDDQDGDYVDDTDDHQEQVNVEDGREEPANDGRESDFEDDDEIPCIKKCEHH